MTMISESGAIRDISEIAAALEVPVETLQMENEAIANASVEELIKDIEEIVVADYNDDIPVFELAPVVDSILQVTNAIKASGSISRSDAMTLHQMTSSLEDFKGVFDNIPISSYTEAPSLVNFDASMESVLSSLARNAIETIKKIIAWIREKAKDVIKSIRDFSPKIRSVEELARRIGSKIKLSEFDQDYFNKDSRFIKVENGSSVFKASELFCRLVLETKFISFAKQIDGLAHTYIGLNVEKPETFKIIGYLDVMNGLISKDALAGDLVLGAASKSVRTNVQVLYRLTSDLELISPDNLLSKCSMLTKSLGRDRILSNATTEVAKAVNMAEKFVKTIEEHIAKWAYTEEEMASLKDRLEIHKQMITVFTDMKIILMILSNLAADSSRILIEAKAVANA